MSVGMEEGERPVECGVERWFEREHSHLRGEAKNHLDRSHFSVGAAVNRPRIWPQRRIAASSAASCAMVLRVVDECRCPKRHLRPSIRPKRAVRHLPRCVFGGS